MVDDRRRGSPGQRGRDRTGYVPEIRYKYFIGGKELEGDRVYNGDAWNRKEKVIARLVDRYPPGARVRVFVDPARPGEAVLEPGSPAARELGEQALVTGIGALVVWVAILLFA